MVFQTHGRVSHDLTQGVSQLMERCVRVTTPLYMMGGGDNYIPSFLVRIFELTLLHSPLTRIHRHYPGFGSVTFH